MERFVKSPEERGALVGGIAAECERAAQLDWAVELYMYAGQPGAALALINDQLSNALQPALSSPAKGGLAYQVPALQLWPMALSQLPQHRQDVSFLLRLASPVSCDLFWGCLEGLNVHVGEHCAVLIDCKHAIGTCLQ